MSGALSAKCPALPAGLHKQTRHYQHHETTNAVIAVFVSLLQHNACHISSVTAMHTALVLVTNIPLLIYKCDTTTMNIALQMS